MDKKSSILTLALATAFAVLPGAAQAQDNEIRVVSSALMDTLEAWSDPAVSYESIALGAHPQLIEEYAPVAQTYHGGRPLAEVFAERLPQTYAEIQQALGGDPKGNGGTTGVPSTPGTLDASAEDILAYAMASGSDEYLRWQTELQGRGAGFRGYVDRYHPEVVAEMGQLNTTPAVKGIGLLDFTLGFGDAALSEEVRRFLGTIEKKKDCTCWTVVNFPDQPSSWTTESNDNYSNSWGSLPKKRQNLNYYVWGKGAARDINFWRKAEHNLWEVSRDKSSNMSSMRVRMSCTKNNSSTGEFCQGPTCKGQFVARIGYSSKVYERHDVGGIWSKQAQALTADSAKLIYDGPGAGPVVTLFNKGVAVSGEYQSGWNASAVATLLYNAVQIGLAVATDGTSLASTLTNDLVNSTVTAGASLITHSGSPGSRSRDMMVAWDNSVGMPIVLNPNETHLFELKASSKLYGRGYGGRSETWGNVDSANYIVGVGRNYQCAANVTPPVARAHWEHGRTADAPYTTPTLQNFIGTFTQTELGVYPGNTAASPGQYP